MADDQRLTRQRIAWEGSEQQHLGYVGKRGELAVDSLLQHYVFYTAAVAVIAEIGVDMSVFQTADKPLK